MDRMGPRGGDVGTAACLLCSMRPHCGTLLGSTRAISTSGGGR